MIATSLQDDLHRILSGKHPADFLRTEKLMEAWYCLKGDHVTAVVDSVRPRVLRLYAHGDLGDFQNLLYDTDSWAELTGCYGIVPAYEVDGEVVTPFIPHAYWFEHFGKGKTTFDAEKQEVRIEGAECFRKDRLDEQIHHSAIVEGYDRSQKVRPPIDFAVLLKGQTLILQVRYPEASEKGLLRLDLYPLYTHYTQENGERHCVEYMQYGLERSNSPRFEEVLGNTLSLEDATGVLPRLTVSSDTGTCRLISHTDFKRNNAARLQVVVETRQAHQEVRIGLTGNAVSLRVAPLPAAVKPVPIEVRCSTVESLQIDGVSRETEEAVQGKHRAVLNLPEGEHEIAVRAPEGFAKRTVYAVDPSREKIGTLADALMHFFWQDPEKRDIIAYSFHPDTLEPLCREGASFIVHGVRALTTLFLGAIVQNKPEYAEQGYRSLKAVVGKSHSFENGDLLVAIWLDQHGRPNPKTLHACRPSDLGIMIRGFLYAARTFRHFGREDRRTECLDYATRYARTYFRMQREDGAFYSRYAYPDLKPSTKLVGTVNNWMIQVWHLAEQLADHDPDTSRRLREMLERYADFCLFKRTPSLLEVTGGADEGPANYPDDLATAAALLGIKYALSGQAEYRDYAEQAFKMSFFYRNHRLDSPCDYMYPLTAHMGMFYDFPNGVPGKGDMTDLTGNEAGVFLKELLGFELGEYAAAYCTAAMFTDSYKPNGAIYSVNVHVPNYTHIMRNYSDVNVYGAVGVVLYWLWTETARVTTPSAA